MTKTERFLMYFVCVCLLIAGLTLTAAAQSTAVTSTMPGMLNPDPAYWYDKYKTEKGRADGLAASGDASIKGLQATLTVANRTIVAQNERLSKLTQRVNDETTRANRSDSLLTPYKEKVRQYEGGTWVGRQLRKADKTVKYVGYGTVLYGLIRFGVKLLLP